MIRPYQPADLTAMQAIRKAAFAPVFGSFRGILGDDIYAIAMADADAEQAALLDSICAGSTAFQAYVADYGGHIVGFVTLLLNSEKRLGEIGLNAVHPAHQSQGIGTAMYDFALARMRDAGMAVATVGTGGDPSHAAARRAYGKAGFGPALPSIWFYKQL